MKSLSSNKLYNCRVLPTRVNLLEKIPENSVGAELGIQVAQFSKKISDIVKPKLFYLVDTWIDMKLEENYTDRFLKRTKNSNYIKRKQTSESFLKSLDDNHLDWVYIDADHSYDSVKTDLLLSKDKVKDDGYIMGDDYINYDYTNHSFWGVKDAVNEFLQEFDYEMIYFTLDIDGYHSYCLRKII